VRFGTVLDAPVSDGGLSPLGGIIASQNTKKAGQTGCLLLIEKAVWDSLTPGKEKLRGNQIDCPGQT